VVAEGVETQVQMQRLADRGCRFMQGYMFSRPVPPDQFAQLLDSASQPDWCATFKPGRTTGRRGGRRKSLVKPSEPGLQSLNDAEIARRALKLLAERKTVPTPEAFADAYWESAGVGARGALHANWTRARKFDSIVRTIGAAGDPTAVLERLRHLVESWGSTAAPPDGVAQPAAPAEAATDRAQPSEAATHAEGWRRLALRCLRALEQACTGARPVREKLRGYLAQQDESSPDALAQPALPPVDWVLALEREIAEDDRVRAGLQRLLGLLCDNLRQLAPDEAWLTNHLEPVRALLAGPIRSGQIAATERRLSALITQQTMARRGLQEAKVALTRTADRAGGTHRRHGQQRGAVSRPGRRVPEATAAVAGSGRAVAHRARLDERHARLCASRSRPPAPSWPRRARRSGSYEARVSQLEHQLSEVSTLAQKDPLTNALNRRGLEHAFRAESARALRYESPLTLAMLDLDNFKQVNDRLGHVAGDRALIHFVNHRARDAAGRPT